MSGQTHQDALVELALPATPPTMVAVTATHSGSPWVAVTLSPPPGVGRCYVSFDAAATAYEVRFLSTDTVGFRVAANTPWSCPLPLDLASLAIAVRTTGGADVEVRAFVSYPAK